MTKIKVVSVLAVAFVLTALGASSAFAWEGVTIHERQDCGHDVLKVSANDAENFLHSKGAPASGSLTVKDSHGKKVTGSFTWAFDKTGPTTQEIGTVPLGDLKAGETYTVTLDDRDDVATTTVTIETCPTPTPTATPTEKPHASATPTATVQPSASATASAQPTSTSVPAPPATGQGPNGGGNNFGIVLLVMVLGTVVIGGTTLALSRKGS